MRIVSTGKISTVFFRHGFLSMVDFFRQIWDCFGSKNFNWIFSTQFLVKGWLFSTKLELFWLKKFRLNFFDTVSCQWLTKTNPAQTLKFPELFSIEDQRNSVNAWTQNFWERKGRMERAKLISEKGSGEGGGASHDLSHYPFSLNHFSVVNLWIYFTAVGCKLLYLWQTLFYFKIGVITDHTNGSH